MRRLGMRTVWALMCAAGLWTSAAAVRAEDESAVGEQLLPPETLFFFSVPDVPECQKHWQSSLMGQLTQDRAMQPFIEALQEKIAEASEKMEQETGVSLQKLLEIPQGEITFAVVELPPRKLALVLLLDYGDNASTVETLLEKMDAALKEAGGERDTEEVGEASIVSYMFATEADNPFNQLAYFNYDSYLVFGSHPDALKAVLERWDGDSEETLAGQDVYKYIMTKCSTEDRPPLLKWYFNPIGTAQSVISLVQNQFPQAGLVVTFLPLLGLDKLKGMGGAADAGDDEFEGLSKGFVYVEQPTTGLLNMFQATATELSPPTWVPDDVASYVAINWNVSGAYSAIETLFDNFQGAGAFGRIIDELAEREDGPGLHLKKDLIDQLTGQIHMAVGVAEVQEAGPPKMAFALDVKNAKKMSAVLAKAAKSEGIPITTREFEGTTIYEAQEGEPNQMSIAVVDQHLMLSSDPSMLENAIRPRSGIASLADNPTFQKVAKKFPNKMSVMSYQNSRGQLKVYYDLLKSGGLPLPEDVTELTDKLPDFEVLAKYLRSSGGYVVPDKKGALSVNFTLKSED